MMSFSMLSFIFGYSSVSTGKTHAKINGVIWVNHGIAYLLSGFPEKRVSHTFASVRDLSPVTT
jgi:hypothetical protein